MMDSDTPSQAEIVAIAEAIERGDDPYVVPAELVEESELQPAAAAEKSLYAQIRAMSVGERIKLALKGNHDARMILIRDTNRLIQRFVLQNPRISEDEVVMIARNRNVDSDVLKLIGENRNWVKNYQVRLGLASNPKTPLAVALHALGTLAERDLRLLAKNKNVSTTVVSQARRLLAQRGK
jgi:hypothetical protein